MARITAQCVRVVGHFAEGANAILVMDNAHIGVSHGGVSDAVGHGFHAMRIMAGGA